MSAMSLREDLTNEQRAILEFLAPAHGEGLTLAHDIAGDIGCSPRGIGSRLRALENRGLVESRTAVDNLCGWEITVEGWDAIAP